MSPAMKRIAISLVIFIVWVSVTLFGMRWLAGGKVELTDSLGHSVAWNLVAAALVVAGSIALFGWKDMRFNAPLPGTLKLLWFPALYLLGFYGLAMVSGFPPASTMLFVFINTLIVGFSEEGMFRGIIYRALRGSHGILAAVVMSSVMFGSVHVLNAFTTGHVFQSVVQACAATLSGFVFVAMLLRTGSIIVPMIYHALWDFGTFTVARAGGGGGSAEDVPALVAYVVPVLFVLPNFLYALWLLKGLRNDTRATALA